MSQAGFGDSSSQERINRPFSEPQSQSQSVSLNVLGEPTTLFNALPRQVLEQELQFCNERSQQAQVLLRQAQEQLQLSQLVIQRQETLTLTLQSRIDQLERELQDRHTNCDELRDRLKRQQHHTSQLKAALERCLDTSTPTPKDMAISALESWSSAKLAEEKITPVEAIADSPLQNVVKIIPAPQPIALTATQDEVLTHEAEAKQPEARQPEAIEIPIQLSIPAKTQPISPLIVRAHKAALGSPIAPNLPKVQPVSSTELPLAGEEKPVSKLVNIPINIPINIPVNIPVSDDNFATSSASAVKNAAMGSPVIAPKFIQALYGNNMAHEEELTQLAIATSISSRKAVTSLAAVKLPQFPPLVRR